MRKSVRGKNHFEATRLVDLILQAGISQCYVSPGSRSTPLVEAIAEAAELNAEVHFDERGAAFAALGYGRATGRAAALVCTSGTAVANYFPAVIEAFQSGIPLLVISADRPLEAINTGANQTIDQREIFGPFVRISLDFEKVDDEVEQALSQLANGPVHLNMRFSKPLLGEEIPGPLPKKFVLVSRQDQVNPQDLECLRQLWEQSSNPLIVVGQFDRSIKIEQLFRELVKLRAPVVATALSGLRAYSTEAECLLCHYEFYLEQLKVFPPDLVLHLGRAQPSIALDNFLEKIRPPMLVIDENCQNFDPYGSLRLRIQANPVGLLSRLKLSCKETKLGQAAKIFERRASIAIQAEADQSSMSEWGLAKILSEQLERGEGMFLSSSLPVREADACISKHAEDLQITSNRGVSGIDGTVASAVGFCQGLGKPVTLVLGDLALLHDLNSLSMVKAVPLTIVAINNDGGGIFELLPIKQQVDSSRFEKFWGTPQGVSFEHAAKLFGLQYSRVSSRAELLAAYTQHRAKPSLIEFVCTRTATVKAFRTIKQTTLGTPIVFLHGYLGSANDFQAVIQNLAGTYCLSLALPVQAEGFESAAMQIREELEQHGIVRAVIAGQSLGGRLALSFARLFPQMVEKLVLMGSHPGLDDEKDRANRWESDQRTARDIQNSLPEDFLRRWYDQPIFASLAQRPEVLADLISRRAGYTPKKAADVLLKFSLAKQQPAWDLLESLGDRLIYIAGELDTKFIAVGQEISRRAPQAKIVTIKNSGHAIYAEEPEELALALSGLCGSREV